MPADPSTPGFPAVGQIGLAAIAAALLFRGLRLPIVAGCFTALIAATLGRETLPRRELRVPEPAPAPRRARQRTGAVQTASEDSFPASDPPSWTPVSGPGTRH